MSKIIIYIGGFIFVILALIFVADYFLNIPITRSIPGINQLTCKSAISVSGSSMEPAIKAGSRVTFNKCFKNRENLPIDTIVLFNGEGNNSIARIKERISEQDLFIYKAIKDNRPDVIFEVRPDRIIGILD